MRAFQARIGTTNWPLTVPAFLARKRSTVQPPKKSAPVLAASLSELAPKTRPARRMLLTARPVLKMPL